jgi:hypothetical protein
VDQLEISLSNVVLARSRAQQAGCVTTFVGRCSRLGFVCIVTSSHKCHSWLDDMHRDTQAEQQPLQAPTPRPTPSPTAVPTRVSLLDTLLSPASLCTLAAVVGLVPDVWVTLDSLCPMRADVHESSAGCTQEKPDGCERRAT